MLEYSLLRKNKYQTVFLFTLLFLLLICLVGCTEYTEDNKENEEIIIEESSEKKDITEIRTEDNTETLPEENIRIPLKAQWQDGDIEYDPNNTIFHKTFYDDFVNGLILDIKHPDVNLQKELKDYFVREKNLFIKADMLVDMFFDNRTIEMGEEALKDLFYLHGYEIYFHSAKIKNLHVRFVEIREINGLSIYPTRILIQTWDEEYIYLQDITGPTPRKIRSILVIDDKEAPQLIVHSSGLSVDYVAEEELSFWTYRGSYWVLAPLELEIDTRHAHVAGETLYPDENRDELFSPTYYRDGIVYRPSRQGDGRFHYNTFILGKMEEIEKNKCFRLITVYDNAGIAHESLSSYIEFYIK